MYKKMKITKYLTMLAAVVGMTAACQKEEFVTFNPDNVVAPVLHAVEDIVVTVDNKSEAVTFTWDAADFGVKTQVYYSLDMAKGEKSVNLFSGVSGTSMNVSMDNINNKAFNDLEIPSGEAGDVLFKLSAKLNVGASYAAAPVAAKVTPTAAEKVYPKLWVVGSYNGWAHDASNLFLYNYAEDDDAYMAVIDFGTDHAANEFKITGGGWGNDEHSATGAQAEEAASVSMVVGGGDNVSAYKAKRFYHLTFSRSALTLSKNYSFDQVGIIGLNGDWNNDIVMEFSKAKQRFYADIDVPAATEMKFRMDADWGVNFGGDMKALTNGGDNIKVEPGQYRVYFDMNNLGAVSCTLDARMYGQEEEAGNVTPEPPVEEPEPFKGWALIGNFNGWGGDLALASDGTYYVVKGVELEGELKFRKDADWAVNFGLSDNTIPFAANTEIALAQDGANINVPAGTYDVYLDVDNAKAWFITDGTYPGGGAAPEASEWGVVGVVNNWGGTPDVVMYKTSTEGLFVARNVEMPDGGFKIRANNEWNDAANYGLESAGAVEVDHAYTLVCSGQSGDMTLVAGTYDIWFDLTNSMVYIMTPGKNISEAEGGVVVTPDPDPAPAEWYLVGNFNGWTAADEAYKLTAEENWYVFKNFTADGQGVKFVADANWSVNRGGTFVAAGEAIAVEQNGSDMMVAAGTYDVYLSKDGTVAYFMTPGEVPAVPLNGTWYLVGNFNGWTAADEAYKMTAENGWYVFKNFTADGQGVKFVADANWSVNRGGTFVAAGEAIAVEHNGSDMMVAAGTYDVYLNAAEDTAYFMEVGQTPAN